MKTKYEIVDEEGRAIPPELFRSGVTLRVLDAWFEPGTETLSIRLLYPHSETEEGALSI